MRQFRNLLLYIVFISAISVCGCSTILNQHDKTGQYSLFVDPGVLCAHHYVHENDVFPTYYGGVSFDLYTMYVAPFAPDPSLSTEYKGFVRYLYPFALVYSVVDLPFSLVADTTIFPYNYYVLSHCYVVEDGIKYSRWSEGSEYRICGTQRIQIRRDEFRKLYDQKNYAQARAQLEPIVKTCSNRINSTDLGWIRNDLAITMYNLGDYAGCLDVLKPLQESADETDGNLREKYVSRYGPQVGPAVADTAIQIAKTTRGNLKLCNRVPRNNSNQNAREGR